LPGLDSKFHQPRSLVVEPNLGSLRETTMTTAEEQPTPVFTCPDWCTVDHTQDGYLKHGHVVHRATDVSPLGYTIGYWQSVVHSHTERVEPVEVHLGDFFIYQFDDPKTLRVIAQDLLGVAEKLDQLNAHTP